MNNQMLKITCLPDLSMPKYGARYGSAAVEMAGRTISDIAALLDHHTDDWLLLRYLYTPQTETPQDRLKLFLRVNGGQSGGDISFSGDHLLKEFYSAAEATPKEALGGMDVKKDPLFLVKRTEEVFHDSEKDFLYYAPVSFPPDQPSVMPRINLDALMHSFRSACLIDITVKPVVLNQEEGAALLEQLKELDRSAAAFDPERKEAGSIEDLSRQRDLLASRHHEFYKQYFETFYSGRVYEFSLRILSEDRREGFLMARALGEALSPHGKARVCECDNRATEIRTAIAACEHRVETFDVASGTRCYSRKLAEAPKKLQGTLEDQFNRAARLSHLCCLMEMEQAERLLELPTSEGVYMRTIRIESELRGKSRKKERPVLDIQIGTEAEKPGELAIGLDQMQKHLLVAGVTGSGKTTSILNILVQLWEKYRIPFLVLEPAKSEYRILADIKGTLGKDIRLYSPGSERLSPFRFNPLEVPLGVTIEEHISALESCFAGAIPMAGGPLPSLISEAIEDCYSKAGFILGDMGAAGCSWPTMKTLVNSARKIMESRGYAGEVKANLQTAIDVRLKSLCQRSVGRMFSFERSFPSLDELLKWPTILEMDALNLDQQNLLNLFLLTSIRERLVRQGPAKELRHIIVLEEAHNLIGVQNSQGRSSEDFADPRGHAARFLVRMLAEIRAFGEGIMVVDQSPAAIASEVLKNTAVKIVHRTVSEDDRDALAAAMLMDKYAHEELARLEVGESFVYNEHLYRPTRVQCRNSTEACTRSDDPALLKQFDKVEWFADAQAARLLHLRDRLDSLMELLRKALVNSCRQIGSGSLVGNRPEWKKAVHEAIRQTKVKMDALIADAKLDRTIRKEVEILDYEFKERLRLLIDQAADEIRTRKE